MEPLQDWYEYRREDKELLGWITPKGEDFVAIDRLGRPSAVMDWVSAEEYLDGIGIRYLAEIYACEVEPGNWVRVRLLEVSTDGIAVQEDNFGDATADLPKYALPFPPGARLVPLADAPGEVSSSLLR